MRVTHGHPGYSGIGRRPARWIPMHVQRCARSRGRTRRTVSHRPRTRRRRDEPGVRGRGNRVATPGGHHTPQPAVGAAWSRRNIGATRSLDGCDGDGKTFCGAGHGARDAPFLRGGHRAHRRQLARRHTGCGTRSASTASVSRRCHVVPACTARHGARRSRRCHRAAQAAQVRAFPLYESVHANFEFESLRGDPAFEALFKPWAQRAFTECTSASLRPPRSP